MASPRLPRAARRRLAKAHPHLDLLSPQDRARFEVLGVAAAKTRAVAHQMLDQQLDAVMPELLTAIDQGHTFAVLVVDPEQMPVMPEPSKLVDENGLELKADGTGLQFTTVSRETS